MTSPDTASLPPRLLGTAPAAAAVAGIPGKFSPWNARRPVNLAALQAAGALGQVAAWTPGQFVELRDGSRAHWAGAAWAAGAAGAGAPAPLRAADADSADEAGGADGADVLGSTVPDGTVPAGDDLAVVVTADGTEHVGILPASAAVPPLTVTAGAPGDYSPALAPVHRPRNVTELRERATPADVAPWAPGQYVLVGERGKRAHWDGEDWRTGEAPDRGGA